MSEIFETPVGYLKGIGPERAEMLKKDMNIFTFEDLLFHFPFRYIDRTTIQPIRSMVPDMPYVQVMGKIESVQEIGEKSSRRLVAILKDESGSMELIWFKGLTWVRGLVKTGAEFIAFGKPVEFRGKYSMVHPELENVVQDIDSDKRMKLQPVYSTTEKLKKRGLDSKGFQRLEYALFEKVHGFIDEILPDSILARMKLMPRKEAFFQIHFPDSHEKAREAVARLKFEELFLLQLKLLLQRNYRQVYIRGHIFEKVGAYLNDFYTKYLPFDLTNAQKRVIKEIRADLKSGKQMNRLLQGDVGSGKTVVALMSMLLALDNGMQACLMAPTEILATQHFQSIDRLTFGMGINVKLLTGSSKKSSRKVIQSELKEGNLHILIGTHALLESWVDFPNLGLVVIDEQHRFGVAQRARLWSKNTLPPHILVMTATPIPRTLAMTLYGDLDTSIIDEMPPGRKDIVTSHAYDSHRLRVFGFMRKQIAEGRQVYIVYPLIEESETLDYKNLMEGFYAVEREFPKPDYYISIVHGKMKPADKEFEMQRFKKGETQIMVSTTVIEVGVDVPNATVMIIESAERFGLSQLHQLRGRVGRGGNQSYCILMTGYKLSKEAKTRMETMVRTNNGFEISEVDLKLRGPGDMAGTQQSGLLNLRLADLTNDYKILHAARLTVQELLDLDPQLEKPENQILKAFIENKKANKLDWSIIS